MCSDLLKKKNAFTLVELLAVIVILGIILAIAVPNVINIVDSSTIDSLKIDAKALINAIQYEEMNNDGFVVTDVNETTMQTLLGLDNSNYSNLEVTIDSDNKINVEITGQGKWEGLMACGNYDDMNAGEGSSCAALVPTDESCFVFDDLTGTITGYDLANPSCPTEVNVPSKIGGVTVEHIGQTAFNTPIMQACADEYENYYMEPVDYEHTEEDDYEYCMFIFGEPFPITSVILPDTVTSIGNFAFAYNQISTISLPNSITSIGDGAFLTQITPLSGSLILPESLTEIGYAAFAGNMISSITFSNNLIEIGMLAFMYNQLENLSVPSSVVSIGAGAFNYNLLPDEEAFIYSRNPDGSSDTSKLVSYGGQRTSNIVIPSTVITIGKHAFEEVYIDSITIPSTTTTIERNAFYYCGLSEITIPASVTTIDDNAFYDNPFTSVTILGADPTRFNSNWEAIGFPVGLMP